MRLPCWPEVLLDAQVDLDAVCLKPSAATLRQFSRLWHFSNAQWGGIEASRRVFTACRHRELNVMDAYDRAFNHKAVWVHAAVLKVFIRRRMGNSSHCQLLFVARTFYKTARAANLFLQELPDNSGEKTSCVCW